MKEEALHGKRIAIFFGQQHETSAISNPCHSYIVAILIAYSSLSTIDARSEGKAFSR